MRTPVDPAMTRRPAEKTSTKHDLSQFRTFIGYRNGMDESSKAERKSARERNRRVLGEETDEYSKKEESFRDDVPRGRNRFPVDPAMTEKYKPPEANRNIEQRSVRISHRPTASLLEKEDRR
jgi:hypothetical protein